MASPGGRGGQAIGRRRAFVAVLSLPLAIIGAAATGPWSLFTTGISAPPTGGGQAQPAPAWSAPAQPAAVAPGAIPSVRWLVGAGELGPQWYEALREVNLEGGWVMVVLRSTDSRYVALGQQVFLLPSEGAAVVARDTFVADELANRSAVAGVSGGTAREVSAAAPGQRAVRRNTSTLDVLSLYATKGRYLVVVEVQDANGVSAASSVSRAVRGLAAVLARVPA